MVNKKQVLAGVAGVAAAVSGAAAAQASDLPSKSAPKAPAPSAGNWDGFYVGGGVGLLTGSTPWQYDDSDYEMNGANISAFAGFNHQMGNTVVGAELAYSSGTWGPDVYDSGSEYGIGNIIDAKAKLGLDMGNGTLLYITGGLSSAMSNDYYYNSSYAVYGYNYGAGVAMKMTDKISLGGEFLARSLSGGYDYDGSGTEAHTNDAETSYEVMLRAAYHF